MKKIVKAILSLVICFGIFASLSVCGTVSCADFFRCKHVYGDWIISEPATCIKQGTRHRVCKRCGEEETDTYYAKHTYGAGVVKEPATCTSFGTKEYTCTVCGESYTQEYKEEHMYDDGVITKKANCITPGEKTYTCSKCRTSYTESYTVEHTYSDKWSHDATHHWHEATCFCNQKFDYAPHAYKDYVCQTCGAYDPRVCITDSQGLLNIANNTKSFFIVMSDIDMDGITWTPFAFSGNLNGNGHTISNLKISTSSGNTGMFSNLSGAVYNLKFDNLSVKSTSATDVNVGGVCGLLNCGIIDNVTVNGTIEGNAGAIGGIAGYAQGKWSEIGYHDYATISNCVNNSAIIGNSTANSGSAGGIAGVCGEVVKIADCENNGNIENPYKSGGIAGVVYGGIQTTLLSLTNSANITGNTDIGGVLGYVTRASYYRGDANYIGNFVNSGIITGKTNVGGVVGSIYYGSVLSARTITFKNGSNSGKVVGIENVGGIFGFINGKGEKECYRIIVERCNNKADIEGHYYVGGIAGNVASLNSVSSSIMRECSNSGNISAEYYVGGIAGKVIGVPLKSCTNKGGSIKCTSYVTEGKTKFAYIGGFVGYGYQLSISDCINEIPIEYEGTGACVGGLAGYLEIYGSWQAAYNMSAGEISDCGNNVVIKAEMSDNVGGLVGCLIGSSSVFAGNKYYVTRVSNTGNISGKNGVGGFFGSVRTEQLEGSEWKSTGSIYGTEKVGEFSGGFYCYAGSTLSKYSATGFTIINGTEKKENVYFGEDCANMVLVE